MSIQKLHIISLEGDAVDVEAQYNPKEIAVDKSVSWSPAKTPTGDTPELQFTAGTNRGMSLELTFDGFEKGTDVHGTYIQKLTKMTAPQVSDSNKDDEKRPPKVKVTWGSKKLPDFVGVVESVSTKYTLFLPDGTPVRATCSVKLKEASTVSFKKGGS